MSVQYVQGDLLVSSADVLVIPVNCVGVAGRGLALQCKQRYPAWFSSYQEVCRSGALVVGNFTLHTVEGHTIMSFPTKDDWRFPSRLDSIQYGLDRLVSVSGPWYSPYRVMAMPRLGCGAGGLSWSQVQPLMDRYLSQLPCTTLIYV